MGGAVPAHSADVDAALGPGVVSRRHQEPSVRPGRGLGDGAAVAGEGDVPGPGLRLDFHSPEPDSLEREAPGPLASSPGNGGIAPSRND
ncbi:hypothetical protein [Streptomyces sp. NPDC059168]|uniref:hypothetical protein n=1 Tax=Streptomyces sp. NPDC059168 TaxID=3346753 RepID=UPI00368ECB61